MKFYPLLITCLRALSRNLMRAFLTVLGIVIGIASVVAIMEIGEGSKQQVKDSIASLGADTVMIFPASAKTAGVSSGRGGRASLFPADADVIMRDCSETVLLATPTVRASGQAIYKGQNWSPGSIQGGNEHYLEVSGWKIAYGRGFDKQMVDAADRVCVVGQSIVDELFAGENPVGENLRIRDVVFTVIGVLEERGSSSWGTDLDDCIYMPWTSIRVRLQGSSAAVNIPKPSSSNQSGVSSTKRYSTDSINFYPGADLQPYPDAPHPLRTRTVDNIAVKIKNKEDANPAMDQIAMALRRQHGLEAGELDDFQLRDRAEFSKMVTSSSNTIGAVLLVVSTISLVVGGVGIMNIMMVSVTERTREIGLRMAVGARPRDIMAQFLLEAVLLCLMGGVIGILLGRTAAIIVSNQNNWVVVSSPFVMFLAVGVAATIGIVFGWYPAYKASRMDPIDALRHE